MSLQRPLSPGLAPVVSLATVDPAAHPAGFWHKHFARDVLPWVTSFSFHAALVIVGLLTYTAIRMVRPPLELQTNVADSPIVANDELGHFGADASKPWEKTLQDQTRQNTDSKAVNAFASASKLNLGANGGGSANDSSASVFTAGLGSIGGRGRIGSGTGPSDGSGDSEGLAALWGAPHLGGNPRVTFDSTNYARRLVFLCDATGSMLTKMATLKEELDKTVSRLRATQSFDILFFQGNNVESFSNSLTPATPEFRRKAANWLEGISSQDVTNPLPALEMAMKLRPEVLYFLTDAADFPDTNAVLALIAKYNSDRKIKINTILFVEDKAEHAKNTASEGLMKKIATDSGGKFKWVEMDGIQQ
jgi:hypothetical protein